MLFGSQGSLSRHSNCCCQILNYCCSACMSQCRQHTGRTTTMLAKPADRMNDVGSLYLGKIERIRKTALWMGIHEQKSVYHWSHSMALMPAAAIQTGDSRKAGSSVCPQERVVKRSKCKKKVGCEGSSIREINSGELRLAVRKKSTAAGRGMVQQLTRAACQDFFFQPIAFNTHEW